LPLTVVDDYADNFLAQQISEVPGAAQVAIGGEQKRSIRVQINPAALASRGLTLEDVRGAIVAATTNAAKGALTTATTTYTIAANDQITKPEQFDDVIIAYRNGAPVRVRDVGRAVSAAADRGAAAFPNNRPGLLLLVSKQPGANVIETVDRIKAQLPKLTADIPPAITVETILDRTVTIRAAVLDVELTLALTIGLVVLVVLLFLRNLWATLIPGTVVVLALLDSFAAMYVLNFSLDNISLMALTIATGFVVDDAIVVVENIYRHIERGASPFEAALDGSREIAFTVLSISLSLVAVFIPLLLMGGIVGRVFREFSMTVAAAITGSALVSLTLAPMMCSRLIRINPEMHGRAYRVIETAFVVMLAGYEQTLDIVLAHRGITLCVFFMVIALTVTMGIQIPKGFFPIQDTGVISGLAEAAQGVSPEEMMRLQRALGEVIRADRDVEGFASWTGSTGGNGNAQTANTARFLSR
jgi:multidrug efflux pump subunit AcrB